MTENPDEKERQLARCHVPGHPSHGPDQPTDRPGHLCLSALARVDHLAWHSLSPLVGLLGAYSGQSHSRVTSTQPSNKLVSHWVEWVHFLFLNRISQRLTQLEQIKSRWCERRKQLVQIAGADWLPNSYLLALPDWVSGAACWHDSGGLDSSPS